MDSLEAVRKRANRFRCKDLSRVSGLSAPYVTQLRNGDKVNPSLEAFQRFLQGVEELEQRAITDGLARVPEMGIKKKPRKQTEVLQTPSRDKRHGNAA